MAMAAITQTPGKNRFMASPPEFRKIEFTHNGTGSQEKTYTLKFCKHENGPSTRSVVYYKKQISTAGRKPMEASIVLIVLFFYMLIQSVFTMVIIVKLSDKKSTLATKEDLESAVNSLQEEIKELNKIVKK